MNVKNWKHCSAPWSSDHFKAKTRDGHSRLADNVDCFDCFSFCAEVETVPTYNDTKVSFSPACKYWARNSQLEWEIWVFHSPKFSSRPKSRTSPIKLLQSSARWRKKHTNRRKYFKSVQHATNWLQSNIWETEQPALYVAIAVFLRRMGWRFLLKLLKHPRTLLVRY